MSGLYNVLFRINPMAPMLLARLGVNYKEIDRFRDCFLNKDGTEIIIYTRTGGNNRVEYNDSNTRLCQIVGFISTDDDPADETYALFRYQVPETIQNEAKEMAPEFGVNPTERWNELIASMSRAGA